MTRVMLMMLLGAASLHAQEPRWAVDVTLASYVEAWDLNVGREFVDGVQAGIDRVAWRGVAIRGEAFLLRARQGGPATWLRGATMGIRARRRANAASVFVDAAGGWAVAGHRVPPMGTRSNYALLLGGGMEIPWSSVHVTLAARWFHLSNNGSEGRHRNPDIQALGGFAGVGWRF